MISYRWKYIKTYIWSGLSILLSFLSMFIVAPLTTSMSEAFGVYSLCISFKIFLRYADLGFITAGRKYAAEAYSVNNHELEKKYVGTSMFIYILMTLVLFVPALFFSFFPEYLIKDITDTPYGSIANRLLLILSFTIPLSAIPKFCSFIYSVRIEEFKIQRLQLFGYAIKIASVPTYFFNNQYDIVGYYLFSEIIDFLISINILYKSKEIGYGCKDFIKCLKLDRNIFNEIKPLALSGLASEIGWVTYYEVDTVAISVLIGANAVAIYAIGKQMQNFVRSLIGIVFSPYPVRINYFVGQKDFDGLKTFFYKLAELFNFIIIPVLAIVLYAKPFVLSWVGDKYIESVLILQLLILTFILHYITSQAASVIYALNKVKDLLKLAIINPLFFWIGVLLTYKFWGVYSFAIFQLEASLITGIYCCILVRRYLNYTMREFYWYLLVRPLLLICIACSVFCYFTLPMLNGLSKGHQGLAKVIMIIGMCCIFALIINLFFNKELKREIMLGVKMVIRKII